MDQRFNSLFNMSEANAIAILDAPQVEGEAGNSRYAAAAQLMYYPTDASINALIQAVQRTDDPSLDNRIVRRKSVESLGKLRASQALPIIRECLNESDHLTIENAVWAIGEIGTTDESILEAVTDQLEREDQNHRVVIHTLAKLNYTAALERIRPFVDAEDAPVASAAISAVCRFTNDYTLMAKVEEFMFHPMVIVRRLAIQDLMDAKYTHAIHEMSRSPVSIAFRLRGIRVLSTIGHEAGILTVEQAQPYIEKTLLDHPDGLDLVHAYDVTPALPFLIQELYQTDFGRCYLAIKTLLAKYPTETPAALFETYETEAHNDYGAHFHVMKLFGWLKHGPAYDLLMDALHNQAPQFQKSRAAAAIALGELGDNRAIPELKRCLESKIWDLQYASLMALEKLGDTSAHALLADHSDWLIQAKAAHASC
ncbi:MAG: HEAT repeat domain-containing protein [Merismopedia sp. SIO2A8]|nr:HEAT repeat domain-containing protein [Symploca sp. SIO2B6]NET50123.1 HEAT repeat domain-containing protein [Merismopedia sp. SIO2A8]